MDVQCPRCLAKGSLDERRIGERIENVRCPVCGHKFPIQDVLKPRHSTSVSYLDTGTNKIVFHGRGGEIFGIQVLNTLFTVLTLGVYKFWGKTKIRRYLYSSTELLGDRFVYHGTGKELLVGWCKAMGILAGTYGTVTGLVFFVHPLFNVVFPIFVVVAIPYAMIGSMRYRLSRTSWRNIRFSFRGPTRSGIGTFLKGFFLQAITLGFYQPYFHTRMRSYWINHSFFGDTPFRYDGSGRDLIGKYIIAVPLGILTLGIYWFWYQAMVERYDWEHTSFSGIRFSSNITGGRLLALTLTNILLFVSTLGIALPWIRVRTIRFKCSCLSLHGKIDFEGIRQDALSAKAVGEGLADYMNIDAGIF